MYWRLNITEITDIVLHEDESAKKEFMPGANKIAPERFLNSDRLHAEEIAICKMFEDTSLLDKYPIKCFLATKCRKAYEHIKTLKELGVDSVKKMDILYTLEINDKAEKAELCRLFQEINNFCRSTPPHCIDILFKRFEEQNTAIFGSEIDKNKLLFMRLIEKEAKRPLIPSGHPVLDKELDGGFRDGICIVGAQSSLGKTTFLLQIADHMAANGNDVLFFALEQRPLDLRCKSISRYSLLVSDSSNSYLTSNQILKQNFSESQRDLFDKSVNKYFTDTAEHLNFHESYSQLSVDQILDTVNRFITKNGKAPIVFIDYLQLLSIPKGHDEKRMLDEAVLKLKNFSNKNHVLFFGISSLNRNSYNNEISMEAFKESGGIEYTADVLIGLQYSAAKRDTDSINNLKKMPIRPIEAVILKNRYGRIGKKIRYSFNPACSIFIENESEE